jgi:hypothetical protein
MMSPVETASVKTAMMPSSVEAPMVRATRISMMRRIVVGGIVATRITRKPKPVQLIASPGTTRAHDRARARYTFDQISREQHEGETTPYQKSDLDK